MAGEVAAAAGFVVFGLVLKSGLGMGMLGHGTAGFRWVLDI